MGKLIKNPTNNSERKTKNAKKNKKRQTKIKRFLKSEPFVFSDFLVRENRSTRRDGR